MSLAHPGDSPGSSCLSQYSPSWEQEGPGRGGWMEGVLAFPNDLSEVHGAGVQASSFPAPCLQGICECELKLIHSQMSHSR